VIKKIYYLTLPIFLLLLLSSCANTQKIAILESLPLPDHKNISCCWQIQQQLSITYDDINIDLQAVIALTKNQKSQPKLTLVLLDPLGRRLLSIDNTLGKINVVAAPGGKMELPAKFLLSSIYLAYWPQENWHEALANSPWNLIERTAGKRTLTYQKKSIIDILRTPATPSASNRNISEPKQVPKSVPKIGEHIKIKHYLKNFKVDIYTLTRQDI